MEEAERELAVCCPRYCATLAENAREIFGGKDIVAILVLAGICRKQLLDERYVSRRLVWFKGSVET